MFRYCWIEGGYLVFYCCLSSFFTYISEVGFLKQDWFLFYLLTDKDTIIYCYPWFHFLLLFVCLFVFFIDIDTHKFFLFSFLLPQNYLPWFLSKACFSKFQLLMGPGNCYKLQYCSFADNFMINLSVNKTKCTILYSTLSRTTYTFVFKILIWILDFGPVK